MENCWHVPGRTGEGMPCYQLPRDRILFPDPHLAEPDGLLAIGGDLSVPRLLLAYRHGIFPWYNPGDPYLWWCPPIRFIIRPQHVHVSHSMRKYMRRHTVEVRYNRDFRDTMHRCRLKREQAEGTWITDEMEIAYGHLAERGWALSCESYVDGNLAGGLYGVCVGRCFFGESMFSEQENGSKLALIMLAQDLAQGGFPLIDCQFPTEHLRSMGGEEIDYETFVSLIEKAWTQPRYVFPRQRIYEMTTKVP